jgi:glutamate 5-kinase
MPDMIRSELLKNVSRMVVKVGTGVLTDNRKQLDVSQMERLVGQFAAQAKAGKQIVLVTSGAVGAGMGVLGYAKRPSWVMRSGQVIWRRCRLARQSGSRD